MNPKEVKTLLLLEEIDKEGCQSQRELSRKLNMSLGLVNAFIKKLSIRGLFKVVKLPNSRVKYILTPSGITEKSNLALQYISCLVNLYKETKQRLQIRFDKLYEEGIINLVVYEANELSEISCALLNNKPPKVVAIIDNLKDGQKINGVRVFNESQLSKLSYDAVIITETENPDKTKEKLIRMHVPAHKILNIF